MTSEVHNLAEFRGVLMDYASDMNIIFDTEETIFFARSKCFTDILNYNDLVENPLATIRTYLAEVSEIIRHFVGIEFNTHDFIHELSNELAGILRGVHGIEDQALDSINYFDYASIKVLISRYGFDDSEIKGIYDKNRFLVYVVFLDLLHDVPRIIGYDSYDFRALYHDIEREFFE